MAQEHKQGKKRDCEQEIAEEQPQDAEKKRQLDEDIDGMLEEIDDVLEENAEDFVKGFIQKGGE